WLTDDYLAASVDAVHLEDILGKVESDCNNLVQGVAPFPVSHNSDARRRWEAAPPIKLTATATTPPNGVYGS
ncbi:hypothetical protein GGD56_007348, partial [Rhizobium mongolense]|nr:hypothetical protein [Rhizobium mongolense]